VGVDEEILLEGLELGKQDAVEGFVGLGRVVEADGLANVFEFIFGVVVIVEKPVDGVITAGDDKG